MKNWDLPETEMKQMISELLDPRSLCPDTKDLKVKTGSKSDFYTFKIRIKLTTAGKAFKGDHSFFATDISKNFNANEYREVGYQKAITPTEDLVKISKDSGIIIEK